jgi:predicted permease
LASPDLRRVMFNLWQSLRHGIRGLTRNPGFTSVAILSLGLGIGANAGIFTLIDALLLKDLPVQQPQRLVEISAVRRDAKIPLSYPMFRELSRGQRVFSAMAAWSHGVTSDIQINGALSQASVDSISGNYYTELGTPPFLGRLISLDDGNADTGRFSPVAVLGYEFWRRRFGGSPDVIGKQIGIEGQSYTIIGVTAKRFTGMTTGEPPQITIPMRPTDNRALLWVSITGRLKDGVSPDQARAQLQSIWPSVLLATASTDAPGPRRQAFLSMGLDVAPATTGVARDLRARFTQPLLVLLGVVGLILLVACVNLANLLLARTAARSHELSVRVALGGSRWSLAGDVLTESLVLSTAGALLGLAFGYGGSRLLVHLITQGYPTPVAFDLRPDWRVLSMTAAVAILTGAFFGFIPAWRCSRQDPASVLQQRARSLAGSTGRLGKGLIVLQLALSLILLSGAGLLVRSFETLSDLDPGFDERVIQVRLHRRPGTGSTFDVNAYQRQLIERLSSEPGLISAGLADLAGPGQRAWQDTVSTVAGRWSPSAGVASTVVMVSPGFLQTLGIRLVRGRDFDWTDDERHPPVAIISGHLGARLFPSGDSVGRHIRFGVMPELQDLEIVGVAGDARLFDLRDARSPTIYLSAPQYARSQFGPTELDGLFVRDREAPQDVVSTVNHDLDSLGHEYAVGTKVMAQEVNDALAPDRVVAVLSSFFAALALLLASIGLYGLTSYAVARRTREVGIRAALGAPPPAIRWVILRDTLALAAGGIMVGIPCALGAGRLIAGMLFGVSAGDLANIFSVSLVLVGVALVAAYVPAHRASRIDPMAALRTE